MTTPIETEQRERVVAAAKKAPVQEWHEWMSLSTGTFSIHDNDGREVLHWSGFDASALTTKKDRERLCRFVGAANPSTILAYEAALEEAEAFSEQRRLVVAHLREETEKHKQALSILQQENERLRGVIQEAVDLLLERIHHNPARSAAHNARLTLQAALQAPQSQGGEGNG